MKKTLLTTFILFSTIASADLRQAIENFEDGIFQFTRSNFYQEQLKKADLDAAQKPNFEKLAEATRVKSVQNMQASYDEFWRLRKMGSTVPIHYMSYLEDMKFTTAKQDIFWDRNMLMAIAKELHDNPPLLKRQGTSNEVTNANIPNELILESYESLGSSMLGTKLRLLQTTEAKLPMIEELFVHWQKSESLNLRAAYHLFINIPKFYDELCKRHKKKTEFGIFLRSLTNKQGKFDKDKLANYFIRRVESKGPTDLNTYMDPGFMLLIKESAKKERNEQIAKAQKFTDDLRKENQDATITTSCIGASQEEIAHETKVIEVYKAEISIVSTNTITTICLQIS